MFCDVLSLRKSIPNNANNIRYFRSYQFKTLTEVLSLVQIQQDRDVFRDLFFTAQITQIHKLSMFTRLMIVLIIRIS